MMSETVLLTIGLSCVTALLVVALFGAMKREFNRISAAFGAVPMVVKALFFICGVSFYLHGSLKTNNTTNAASTMMFAARPSIQTTEFINQTEMYVNAWNATGVWEDSFWCRFENDFVFPFGTNHLKGVEVLAWGEIWSTHRKAAVLADLGERVAIGRGISRFSCEYFAASETNEAKYVYSWYNGLVNRETNSVINGRIELRRSGDILVATNGIEQLIPRQLPFEYNGFGQDDEWVAANFTNANEILSVGYSQWVDDQVGVNLTNGLYKLTVTVPEKPLETTQLNVGDYSVAVTNAGEYVFLLEKGITYPLSVFPETATNFLYAAVDDVSNVYSRQAMSGYWTEDHGHLELIPPISPLSMSYGFFRVRWNPLLHVSPETWQPTENDPTETFTAVLVDCPNTVIPEYYWSTSDSSNVRIASPDSRRTEMECIYPQINEGGHVSLSLEVFLNQEYLYSYFNIEDDPDWDGGSWGSPDFSFRLDMPKTFFVNNDDDNENGTDDRREKIGSEEDDNILCSLCLDSMTPAYGTIKIDAIYGLSNPFFDSSGVYEVDAQKTDIIEGISYDINGLSNYRRYVRINPAVCSESYLDSEIRLRWTPTSGAARTGLARFTVVEPIVEPICNQTTNVIVGGVERKLTVNPCGVAIGENAYFRIELNPSDYPDDKIVWSVADTSKLEFVGGNHGRSVTVRGLEKGKTELLIQIGDSRSSKPSFSVNVVEKREIDVRAWIITDGEEAPATASKVFEMINEANDIYSQVGVSFNLVEPITVTNIPSACKAYYNSNQAQEGRWTFDRIVDIASDTGGIECYFIDSFIDKEDTMAANNSYGMVMTKDVSSTTFAHECGHLFGMRDIYIEHKDSNQLKVNTYEMASYERMSEDWNGGCYGNGMSGARYYRYQTSMRSVIQRMLMFGLKNDSKRDIVAGDVFGLWYEYIGDSQKEWRKSLSPVGWNFEAKDETFNFYHY